MTPLVYFDTLRSALYVQVDIRRRRLFAEACLALLASLLPLSLFFLIMLNQCRQVGGALASDDIHRRAHVELPAYALVSTRTVGILYTLLVSGRGTSQICGSSLQQEAVIDGLLHCCIVYCRFLDLRRVLDTRIAVHESLDEVLFACRKLVGEIEGRNSCYSNVKPALLQRQYSAHSCPALLTHSEAIVA